MYIAPSDDSLECSAHDYTTISAHFDEDPSQRRLYFNLVHAAPSSNLTKHSTLCLLLCKYPQNISICKIINFVVDLVSCKYKNGCPSRFLQICSRCSFLQLFAALIGKNGSSTSSHGQRQTAPQTEPFTFESLSLNQVRPLRQDDQVPSGLQILRFLQRPGGH